MVACIRRGRQCPLNGKKREKERVHEPPLARFQWTERRPETRRPHIPVELDGPIGVLSSGCRSELRSLKGPLRLGASKLKAIKTKANVQLRVHVKRTNTKRSKNNFTRSLLLLRVLRASLRSILQTHSLLQTVTYNGAETSETSETVETSESFWQISGGFLNAASGQCFGSFGFLPCPVEQRLCFRMLFDPNNYSVFITCFIS